MEKIDCRIIMDLLPNYVEELTCEYTDNVIKAHLESCEKCHEIYEQMTEDMELDESEKIPESAKLLNFMEKMRSRAFLKGALIAAVICMIIWGIIECYLYVKSSAPVPVNAVSTESYLLEDGSVYVSILVSEEYPVHGWYWEDDGDSFTISAQRDQVPLDWIYWIECHLPIIGTEDLLEHNKTAFILSPEEAKKTEVIFFEDDDMRKSAVLYNSQTVVKQATEEIEKNVKEGSIFEHKLMNR